MSSHNAYVPVSLSAGLHCRKNANGSCEGNRIAGAGHHVSVGLLIGFLFMIVMFTAPAVIAAETPASGQAQVQLMNISVPFVANTGQLPADVKFYADTFYGRVFVTNASITHAVAITKDNKTYNVAIKEQFISSTGRDISFVPSGEVPTETKVSYFIGNDQSQWRTGLPTYDLVSLGEVYPGIDVKIKAHGANIEKLFTVSPGRSPDTIRVKVEGADRLRIADDGSLVIATDGGEISLTAPMAYQDEQTVNVAYRVLNDNTYGFTIGAYDSAKSLVIDPSLAYSTYLGGSGQETTGHGIAVDSVGNAYYAGITYSSDFPTTTGAYQTSMNSGVTAFVTKVNPTGTGLVYSTYLGGSSGANAYAVTADSDGNAYASGYTSSTDFPVTPGAYQTTKNGQVDIFVTKLNPSGTALVYSTYLGGSKNDMAQGIAVDASGNAYVSAKVVSTDFPTLNAYQSTYGGGSYDASLTKLNPTGTALIYSTYLGGSGTDDGGKVAVDSAGDAYITGDTVSSNFPVTVGAYQTTFGGTVDGFLTKLNPSGSVVYSTYLGGSGTDNGIGITVDSDGDSYVSGTTTGSFPTTSGAYQTTYGGGGSDCFVTKLNPTGAGLVYSTYLGGSGADYNCRAVAIDSAREAYVPGQTLSTNFPVTSDAFQSSNNGGSGDAVIAKLDPAGSSLIYGSYLGGTGMDGGYTLALDPSGNAYLAGFTQSSDFPVTSGAFKTSYGGNTDTFVAKFSFAGTTIAPVAAFTATPTSGISPLNVTFTDQSVNTPTSWAWNFGDGSTSTEQNVTHTYTTAGTYTVTLTATNSAGSNTATQTGYITVSALQIPVASFTATPVSGTAPLSVTFTDTSSNNPTSWFWDFGDNSTSTTQNPAHAYTAAGNYTVALTTTNAAGSNTVTQSGYIRVSTPVLPDLTITGIVNPVPAGAVFAWEPNPVTITNVKNNGTVAVSNVTVGLYASDVSSATPVATITVASLASGATTTVSLIDPTIRNAEGGTVTYTAVVDPFNQISETYETNNNKTSVAKPVKYNGYKGKGIYWAGGTNGGNITTKHTYDLRGGVVYFTQPASSYKGVGWTTRTETWTSANLPIPSTATIEKVWLYFDYNWDQTPGGYPNLVTTFNGNSLALGTPYRDWSNFGSYADYEYGLYPAIDVTSMFVANGDNTLITNPGNSGADNQVALYPSTLVVVYSDPTATRKQIFLNEECDELGVSASSYGTTLDEATAYAEFSGMTIDTAKVTNATLHSFVGSAGPDEGNLLFNGRAVATNAWEGTSSTASAQAFDVKNYLAAENNVAGIQGTTSGGMDALQQILVVEYGETRPTAGFTGTPASGTAPLNVTFTDQSDNGPTAWLWDFGDNSTSTEHNPVHTYTAAGNYTVVLTATNSGGSDTVTKTNYISVAGESSAVVALPGQTTAPTDPDHDGLYEDLNGNGGKDLNDAVVYFKNIDWVVANEPVFAFDYNGNGGIDLNDIILLYKEIIG